jgi:large subunit ribosomal protein L18
MSNKKVEARRRRHIRVRKKVSGSGDKPRLNVFKSSRHIYAQIIDDLSGKTLVSASTLDKDLKGKLKTGGNAEAAQLVGALIAERATGSSIEKTVFDRGGFVFHGRVKALADAARKGGLKF